MSKDLGYKFLQAALGQAGAKALRKAVDREPQLRDILIPRTIVGWLSFTAEHEYEGQIPGVENSYVQFQKSEDGFSGTIGLESGVYSFEKSSLYHLAASVALALGLEPNHVDPQIRDTVLVKLGKSIDTLAKAQALVTELKSPKALAPTKMTTHGSYHVEHDGGSQNPYSVVHTRTGSPVQTGIASLKDAQPIADWHHHKYGGYFIPSLSKKVLDPNSGVRFEHVHHDMGGVGDQTHIKAIMPDGKIAGETLLEHHADGQLEPQGVMVHLPYRRQGIASAMYAHAQKLTGKKIRPSTDQTAAGKALWAGNAKQPQFGKVELPGQSHQPTVQAGPMTPMAPTKQPKQQRPPNLSLGKSEAQKPCLMCGGQLFKDHKFRGCICFGDLSKSITTTAYGDGYVLTFRSGVDKDTVRALMKQFRQD